MNTKTRLLREARARRLKERVGAFFVVEIAAYIILIQYLSTIGR